MNSLARFSFLVAATWMVLCTPAATQAPAKNTCLDCHAALEGQLQVTPERFNQDIHSARGLGCASCHGGDPSSDDNAMGKSVGFRGHIDRSAIPALCGKCHGDGAYMRKYNPSLRTDQLTQYKTSVHGKRVAAGDRKPAVCIDCHGVHEIRAISDTRSSVHPVNVAKTCSRCHSDREYMKEYKIPTDQFAEYSQSVHQEAISVRGDLSAPTCTTCHGNHGAAPPGVAAVENVCSTCHVFQAQLFDSSPHKAAFAASGQPGCVTCHSNHRIVRPTDSMVGTGPESICTNCHTQGDAGWQTAAEIRSAIDGLEGKLKSSDETLTRAANSGMEVGEAQLEQTQVADWLTKARVSVHSFKLARIKEDIQSGEKIVSKTNEAGKQAMKERNYRRVGLGVSIAAILLILVGLHLWIKEIELPS